MLRTARARRSLPSFLTALPVKSAIPLGSSLQRSYQTHQECFPFVRGECRSCRVVPSRCGWRTHDSVDTFRLNGSKQAPLLDGISLAKSDHVPAATTRALDVVVVPRRQPRTRLLSTAAREPAQPDTSRHSCGLSYSQFVRKCSECLTERQLERVALRLKIYKGLKKPPRPHSRLAVVRDVAKIIPRFPRPQQNGCALYVAAKSVAPYSIHGRDGQQDEVGDGMPQSIMGDYTVGAQLLRTRSEQQVSSNRANGAISAWGSSYVGNHSCPPQLAEDFRGHLREIANRPPTPTRLTEKRIGELLVDWQDRSIPPVGTRSEKLVFLSNLPHAPRDVLTDVLRKVALMVQAFSGCGRITDLEIFDDRLRTLDQTDENTMQSRGENAISGKLRGRFSPIFALAEFSSRKEKENACSTYLRAFGVPCIDRLVYPEDAAVKKALIATNLPYVLTAEEVVRILSFALVHETAAPNHHPAVCRIRMTNPGLYGYDQVFVEARSDMNEPFFLLPLHADVPSAEKVAGHRSCETTIHGSSRKFLDPSSIGSNADLRNTSPYFCLNRANDFGNENLSLNKQALRRQEDKDWTMNDHSSLKVCADADGNIFLPGATVASSQMARLLPRNRQLFLVSDVQSRGVAEDLPVSPGYDKVSTTCSAAPWGSNVPRLGTPRGQKVRF